MNTDQRQCPETHERLAAAAGFALATLAGGLLIGARRRRRFTLRGKAVLITGGSRGLGLALAREFAAQGARLAICSRDAGELADAERDLRARGAQVISVRCDVADRKQVEGAFGEVEVRLGGIDVLVNVAGIIQVGPMSAMSIEDYESILGANFLGVVNGTYAVLPRMRRGGRIVNVTSIGGAVPVPHLLPYCASKFAALGFSEGAGVELARQGIRVTTVVPGLMRTGSHVQALFKGKRAREFRWFALGATTPGISMNADRAARRIVQACRRGEAFVVLGLPAKTLRVFHALLPSVSIALFRLVNRVLPGVSGNGAERDAAAPARPGWEQVARPKTRAVRDFNQKRPGTYGAA